MNCAYLGCDCHDALVTITIEQDEPKHYCNSIHAAMALLIDAEILEYWPMDEVRERIYEAREARLRRKPSSSEANAVAPSRASSG